MTIQTTGLADFAATEARRRAGIVIMLASAVVFSTAGLFTKGVTADAWSVIFWRALFGAIFIVLYVVWKRGLHREFVQIGYPGLAIALAGALASISFIAAFKLTTIANVSLIYAAAPFFAAAIAWVWMGEIVERRVLIAALVAAPGVVLIVGSSVGHISFSGDALALCMTILVSLVLVIYRRYPGTPAAGPTAVALILVLPVALIAGDPFEAQLAEIGVLAIFGFTVGFAAVTLSEGARRLAPGEAALVSSLETPLAILWAWMLFAERPGLAAVIGGSLILLSVFGSQLAARSRAAR